MTNRAVLSFPEYQLVAEQLAAALDVECLPLEIHTFPDAESKLTLPHPLPRELILVRSLHFPNTKLIELLLVAKTARQKGVEKLTLVAPYLCYMRQDKAFTPGEIVSQRIIGSFLAELFDRVVTVDPHLHRISHLSEAIPHIEAISLTATHALGEFLIQQEKNFFLLGPDEESEQWVSAIAEQGKFEYAIAKKIRYADRRVEISLPGINVKDRDVVLVDDMVSTGRTMIETAKQLQKHKAASISCLVTHALFSDDAIESMQASGIDNIWSSDAIPHSSNAVSLVPLLSLAF